MAIHINTLNGGDITITTGGSTPAGHADTWVKYTGDTEWTPVSIKGEIAFIDYWDEIPTGQVENPYDIVAIEIGTDVTSIALGAFYHCSNLTSLTIGKNVTSIENAAFSYCGGLTSLTIGENVTSIGYQAFYECSGLTNVVFQGKSLEQVQNIEDGNGNKEYPWGISDTSIISVA